ncbi:hypothetical protein SOVF_091020 isoform A [Spinacia oleracea]|nr:hypothetical protein SOVF_091020 isoform A [Spinacia oleracea]
MRGFSSFASRASPALRNLTENHPNQLKPFRKQNPTSNSQQIEAQKVGGKCSPNSHFNNSSFRYSSEHKFPPKSIDHKTLNQILLRKDWHLLLNHELKAGRVVLTLQSVVSILQNQENPLFSIRFYVWVLNANPLFEKNQRIRSVLANNLHRKGPVLLNTELVENIRNSGYGITEDFLCILIGSWGRLGLAKYCVEIFGQISFLGLSPTTRLYNAVLDALIKSNSLDLAYLKFQQMPSDYCKPDRFTYNILIHGVCKAGVVDEALRLVKQMASLGYAPNVFTYTILIDGYCNANRANDALRVLETMRVRKVAPSDATYRSLVHGVFRCLGKNEAFELFLGFVEREPILPKVFCDTVLHGLSSDTLAREAALFLQTCRERGYLPDTSVFNITITCLIKKLNVEETCEIVNSYLKLGLSLSLNTYLTLIETLFKEGHEREGSQYLMQMYQAGLLSNVNSFNMVIACLLKSRMTEEALDMFLGMQERGITPSLATFNTLIDGYFKAGKIDRASELLVMLLQRGFKPDIFTFSSVIDGLCRVNKIKDAFDCFAEMKEWGVSPNTVTYNILIRSMCIVGDISRSMALFRKMKADGISPDVYSFNALIQSFCKMNNIGKAQNLLVSMLALGLAPDNVTYSTLIKSMCDTGKSHDAMDIFLSMEVNGCVPDSQTCNLFVDTLVKLGQFKEAQDVASRCNQWGRFSHKAYAVYSPFNADLAASQMRKCLKRLLGLGDTRLCDVDCVRPTDVVETAGEEDDYEPQIGVIGGHPGQGTEDHGHEGGEEDHGTSADPTHIIDDALVCFYEKHLYSQCDESCRLTAKGELHVPHDHVDEFCSGPCLEETNLVLDCIDGIMDHFIFFNKATTQDVRDTILAGCGHGDKRGFFDVGEHIEADEGSGNIGSKATISVLSGILISIIGQIVLLL